MFIIGEGCNSTIRVAVLDRREEINGREVTRRGFIATVSQHTGSAESCI